MKGNWGSVGLGSCVIHYHKLCSVSVLHCSELSMAALNYLRDSSHLWGNPTDSPLCPTCSRRGRRVAGALLPEITWQRNLAAAVLAPGWYLVQRLLLQMEPVIATEQSQGFQADVLMPGRNKGLFSQMVQDHSEEDGCVSKEHFRVVGAARSKQKRLSTRLNLYCLLARCQRPRSHTPLLCGKWQSIFPHPQAWPINPEQCDGCSLSPLTPARSQFNLLLSTYHPADPCVQNVAVLFSFSCTYLRKHHSTYICTLNG